MSKFWLYKIINTINWKLYIGITTKKNPIRRWTAHISESRVKYNPNYNRYLCKAIRKYGVENFKFQIIKEYSSLEELRKAEIRFTKFFDTFNHNYGYNLTTGGEGSPGHKMSKESREIKSVKSKANWASGTYSGLIKISNQMKISIVNDYISGEFTNNEIAATYGISLTSVKNIVKGNKKIKIKKPKINEKTIKLLEIYRNKRKIIVSEQQHNKIIDLYFNKKATMKKISIEIGLSFRKIQRIIEKFKKENNIETKKNYFLIISSRTFPNIFVITLAIFFTSSMPR